MTIKIHYDKNFSKEMKSLVRIVDKKLEKVSDTVKVQSLDLLLYGRTNNISPNRVTGTSVIGLASRKLGLKTNNLFYKTFIRKAKVKKNYASAMVRTNSIPLLEAMLTDAKAKKYYGFGGRRGKVKRDKAARKAINRQLGRVGKRKARSGTLTIAGRTVKGAIVADGSYRSSSEAINQRYMKYFGADKFKLGNIDNPFFVFTKKEPNQPKAYGVKAEKISSKDVGDATDKAVDSAISSTAVDMEKMQDNEVFKVLKRSGLKVI